MDPRVTHHAERASSLLAGIDARAEQLDELDEQQRLELYVTGGVTRLNRDLEWTATLAIAHALTALAIAELGNGGE